MSIDTTYTSATSESGIRQLETTRKVDNDLGKDAFLQILITQMSNQDPLSPTNDTEFIAQMAQFSSLEQMQNMNETMQSQAVYNYLGKDVTAAYVLNGDGSLQRQDVYGSVTGVTKVGGVDYLQVQDYESGITYLVPPDQVISAVNSGSATDAYLANISVMLNQLLSEMQAANAAKDEAGEAGESGGGEVGAPEEAQQV